MKKIMTLVMVALLMTTMPLLAVEVPPAKSFDQTDGVLARARAIEDIEYKTWRPGETGLVK